MTTDPNEVTDAEVHAAISILAFKSVENGTRLALQNFLRSRTSATSDAARLDWVAVNGSFGVDSVSGVVGGNGLKRKAATRKNIDAAIAAGGSQNG